MDPRWQTDLSSAEDLEQELRSRVDEQLRRTELAVDHYRIGHRWAFPLPVGQRPVDLPAGVPGVAPYPWLIWLTWELVERWEVLRGAATRWDDAEARRLVRTELAALAGWDHFREWNDKVSLPTGHLAMSLARELSDPDWDPEHREQAHQAARTLLHTDVPAWYEETWLGIGSLANIPMIVLCSVAALARVVGDPSAEVYAERVVEAVETWFAARSAEHLTEQTAYNGYLFDSVTQWMEIEQALGTRHDLAQRWRSPLLELGDEWAQLSVPGRADLAVPLGDVESEMTQWLSCAARFTRWYGTEATAGTSWLLRRCSPERLPATALVIALHDQVDVAAPPPPEAAVELPSAVALRTGWNHDDRLVAVGVGRHEMGHLHHDTGHVVMAWRGTVWITDPGYQQYVPGPERDYTLGSAAHNTPVITVDGSDQILQSRKEGRVVGLAPVQLDLTDCYAGLPATARLTRAVRQADDRVIVDDAVTGLAAAAEVTVHWLAAAGLAWSFVDGWIRWSDGTACLWLGTGTPAGREHLSPTAVVRHPGSRGPIGVSHTWPAGNRQWQFVQDRQHGWHPPTWVMMPTD